MISKQHVCNHHKSGFVSKRQLGQDQTPVGGEMNCGKHVGPQDLRVWRVRGTLAQEARRQILGVSWELWEDPRCVLGALGRS